MHCNRSMYLSIPGTGFKLVELGFWILIVSGIPDSLTFIPYSKAQDSRFRIPQTKILDSGIRNPLHSAFQALRYLWQECSWPPVIVRFIIVWFTGTQMYQVQTSDYLTKKCWFLAISNCNSTGSSLFEVHYFWLPRQCLMHFTATSDNEIVLNSLLM